MSSNNFFIYSHFDFSKKSAGATRMLYYARTLADDSNQVYLISCCQNKINDENFDEIEPNIFVLERKKLTTNFFHIISFLRNLYFFSSQKNKSGVFIHYPFPLVSLEILSLIYLKLVKNQSVFYELNEIRKYSSAFHAPLTIKNIKYSFKKIIFKTAFTVMEPLLYFYDGLICISTSIQKYGSRYNKNTIRIPILTDPHLIIQKSNNIYAKQGVFNIGFSGSIHPSKENLVAFVNVITELNKNGYPISFNLCGQVDKKHYDQIFKNELTTYYGNLNEIELSTFLSQQDLLVIPRGYSLQNQFGFSTKLSDYLNHQKLILLTDISDNKLYIKDGINGFIVPPNQNTLMYDKIKYIIQNFESLKGKVIPHARQTSINEFYYLNFKNNLSDFLTNNQ